MQMECESLIFARLFIYISHGFSLYRHTRLFCISESSRSSPASKQHPGLLRALSVSLSVITRACVCVGRSGEQRGEGAPRPRRHQDDNNSI